jgi:hypothetical protein
MALTLNDIRAGLNNSRQLRYKSRAVGKNMPEIRHAVDKVDFNKSSDSIVVVQLNPNIDGWRVTAIGNLYFKD